MSAKDWRHAGAVTMKTKGNKDEEMAYSKHYPDKLIFTRLLEFLHPYKREVYFTLFLLICTTITNLVYPVGMTLILHILAPSEGITTIVLWVDDMLLFISPQTNTQLIVIGCILGLTLLVNFATKRAYNYHLHRLSQQLMSDIRRKLFSHVQDLSLKFHNEMPAGKLMSRLTNDVSVVQALISVEIIQGIGDLFAIVSTLVLMFAMAWNLSIIILLLAPIFALIFAYFAKRTRKYWLQERRTVAEITGILQETISGSRTIKAFVTEEEHIDIFHKANKANKKVTLNAARVQAFLQPVIQMIVAVALGLLLYFGSMFIQMGQLDVTLLLGYVLLALQFLNPFNNLGQLYNNAQHGLASGDRILNILDTKPDIVDKANAPALPPVKGIIEYDHLNFEYVPNVPVLSDICFKTTPKQRVALVGFTGAGKSTFISLLGRFYDPTSGRLLVDGYDLRDITAKSLRNQMGTVLQDTFLFSGSIMENIRYGKLTATDAEVIETAKKVGADPFIMCLPEGYQTDVRERGSLLSIGQRQLIAFARALLANPPILILDEATSSVDPYTELKIQEALEILLKDRNSFVIAHRLSTILNADVILVMENGKIIQKGSHEQLVKQDGLYKHLYEMQFRAPSEKEKWQRDAKDT